MGSRLDAVNVPQFVTEVLDDSQQAAAVAAIVRCLSGMGVEAVNVEFGYVYERERHGQPQGKDGAVPLARFESFVARGLEDGTIEWAGTSDFFFSPVGLELKFKLCNDADLHFYSREMSLLIELSRELISSGIKVYHEGKAITLDC